MIELSLLVVILELKPPVFQLLSHFQSFFEIACDAFCYFVDLLLHLLIFIIISFISVFSILFVLLFLASSLILLILSPQIRLPFLDFFIISADRLANIFIHRLPHLFSKLSFQLFLLSLLKLIFDVFVLLLPVEIIHKLLSKIFVTPIFSRLVASVLILLLLTIASLVIIAFMVC